MSGIQYVQSIKCGRCKGYHASVDEVRICCGGSRVHNMRTFVPPTPPAPVAVVRPHPVEVVPVKVPLWQGVTESHPAFVPGLTTIQGSTFDKSKLRAIEDHVPVGRYAVEYDGVLKFYEITVSHSGQYKGWKFVKVRASDQKYQIRNPEVRYNIYRNIIAAGLDEARIRFGREIGACGCCGKSLTDEKSRRHGIGPDCWVRHGYEAQYGPF